MLISDRKFRLWMSCAVLIGVGMAVAVLLNEPVQHERASSREVVIDMPPRPLDFSAYATPASITAAYGPYYQVGGARCTTISPGFTIPGAKLEDPVYCRALLARSN
jgi:hypothetical protein